MSTFGASAPAKVCFEKFGITAEKVIEASEKSIRNCKEKV
jgi:transketolase